ncbi:hypothetical protein D3C80_1789260 [compost metagenome]
MAAINVICNPRLITMLLYTDTHKTFYHEAYQSSQLIVYTPIWRFLNCLFIYNIILLTQ